MSDDGMRALAKRFFDCVEAGDIDGLVACYAPEAKIWHNTDGLEQTPQDNRRTLTAFAAHIDPRTYADRRLQVFPGGFVHQHRLIGTRKHDGVRCELEACIVCEVKDGRITRLDEYFDSAAVAEFRKTA